MATSPSPITLPEGYTLEKPQSAPPATVLSTLPPGYTIEGQQPPATSSTQTTQPSDFEAQQDEARQLAESGAGPAAAYMKPGQTAAALTGMVAAGSGAGALAGIMGLAAPGVINEEVATGLLDEFGEPITREIVKQGPSVLGKGFQAAAQWAVEHPTTTKLILSGAKTVGALKILQGLAKLEKEFGQ